MDIVTVAGDLLDARALQEILALRSEVFVVEQSCHYQDVDGRDLEPSTEHLWVPMSGTGAIASYLRVLDEGDHLRIGRVVTRARCRGEGLAAMLVRAALAAARGPVVLSAQSQLTGWYEQFGFSVRGPEYLDAGLPHRPMRRD
jgi:ElaA protein